MHARSLATAICLSAGILTASPAAAQYGNRVSVNDRATGETYTLEVGGFIWNPDPQLVIQSEGLGIIGDQVDFVKQLGIQRTTVNQLKVAVRPGTKHKLRFEYTPITYDAQTVVPVSFVFNGQEFHVGVPVETKVEWKAYRFGYEWDFVYRDRGFAGVVLDLKYTDAQATLTTAFTTEFTRARAPIPAIGFIGRGYVLPNISITGEFTAFKLPDLGSGANRYSGHYFDLDIYGTVNFTDHFGVDVGYRSFDIQYLVRTTDTGSLQVKGIYFGGKARI